MRKITSNGQSGIIGSSVRSPMGKLSNKMRKGSLNPGICPDVSRKDIGTAAAKVRSAQTMGNVVKPWS